VTHFEKSVFEKTARNVEERETTGEDGMKAPIRIALAVTTALGWITPALAQNASDTDIIVTARRSEERLQDVPISITVLSQDTITKRNIVSTADLGAYVPSLSSNQQFGPEKSSFVIRGFT
jgi:iron complex outermembrane receptor protein